MNASRNWREKNNKNRATNHFITTPFNANNVEKFPQKNYGKKQKNEQFHCQIVIIMTTRNVCLLLLRLLLLLSDSTKIQSNHIHAFFGYAFCLASVYGNAGENITEKKFMALKLIIVRLPDVHLFVSVWLPLHTTAHRTKLNESSSQQKYIHINIY